MADSEPADDETIRQFIRAVLVDMPTADYEDFEARWMVRQAQWLDEAERQRLRRIFGDEATQWRARPGYAADVGQWQARQEAEAARTGAAAKKRARIVSQTAVGASILFGVLSILVGSVEGAAGFLFVAVVCTAGVSLVILLPLCWVVGWLVLEVIGGIRSRYGVAQGSAA